MLPEPTKNPHYTLRSTITTPQSITTENMHLIPPVSKFDTDRVELLLDPSVDPNLWIPIIPALLSWTLDWHWPSAMVIFPLLRSNPITIQACIPLVIDIMDMTDGRDDEHQRGLLWCFVQEIAFEHQVQMLDCLKRFLANTTDELEKQWAWREDVSELIGDIEEGMASPSRAVPGPRG